MTALIFGGSGQDGFYLNQLLENKNTVSINISRPKVKGDSDLTNYNSVKYLIQNNLPDFIFHLAANSTTKHEALFENHQVICTGTLNILEAVKEYSPNTKVFISGSGLQFENKGIPIKETDTFEARDAYSLSRIHSTYAARYYRSLGVKTYVGYFFNHDSPRRTSRHMAKKITSAVKRIQGGSNEKIAVGNMNVKKEWTFAGDVVKAIWQFVNQDSIFESNLGSGIGYTIKQWIEVCFKIIDKDWNEFVYELNDFKPEYEVLVSDPTRIHTLGWSPNVSFEDLANMMIKEPD